MLNPVIYDKDILHTYIHCLQWYFFCLKPTPTPTPTTTTTPTTPAEEKEKKDDKQQRFRKQ